MRPCEGDQVEMFSPLDDTDCPGKAATVDNDG